jgi:hypothetical protein
VRGHAGLGHQVHGLGAQLEFDVHARRADQRRVQRLVAVDLRDRDVVLEAARHRLVLLVQQAQRRVAVGHRRHDDAEAVDVGDLREAQVLLVHLAVDGVQRLLAAGDAHLHAGGLETPLDVALHLLDQVAAAAARARHGLDRTA